MYPLRMLAPLLMAAIVVGAAAAGDPVQVTSDGYLNYMPSLLQCADGRLLIVYERLDANFENGDLMAVFSEDGATWTAPSVVVAGPGNDRHPSVVQRDDGALLVFYLSDETGGYKIHHASSPDGAAWTALGAVSLGWTTESLVNPTVCREPDGSFTMAYDRLSAGGYVAHSEDGLAWDHQKTSVSAGSLNRIMRHSDGTYLLSYQRRTGTYYYQIDIFTKTSSDRVTWSVERRVTTNQNSHDSFPLELADGTYGLYYAKSTGGQPYDLVRRGSPDGAAWGTEEGLLPYAGWDTQPHPVLLDGQAVGMAWPRGAAQNATQIFFVLLDQAAFVEAGEDPAAPLDWIRAAPNPFRGRTEFRFERGTRAQSEVSICDIAGRRVAAVSTDDASGRVFWNGADFSGRAVPPGVYFARKGERGCAVRIVRIR